MSRLNTNGDIFPTGEYRFKIVTVPEKGMTTSGYAYYQFQFITTVEGEERPYSERFMVWLMAPICRAMGFEEIVPGEFEWEPAWCLGKEVDATIVHEKIAKGPSAGQVVARMKAIASGARSNGNRAALAAQAPIETADGIDIPF